jgi:amino acid transporter
MGLVGACFAQAGSRFTRNGGAYLFVHTAFGPHAALAAGGLSILSRLFAFATISNLAIAYVSAVWAPLATGAGRASALTCLTAVLAAPIYRGLALSARANHTLTLCKLALLLGFIAIAIPAFARHGVEITAAPAPSHLAPALLLLLFSLTGLESTVINAGEMQNPARDIPFALAAGLTTVVAIYSAVLLASAALVPNLAHSTRPLFDGATTALGPAGGTAVVLGGVASMCGVLFVILFTAPRELTALAANGQLPIFLAQPHPRWHTPTRAILIYAALACTAAVTSSFLGALTAATTTRLILYAAVAAASMQLRHAGFAETADPMTLPGGAAIPLAAIALCVAVVTF